MPPCRALFTLAALLAIGACSGDHPTRIPTQASPGSLARANGVRESNLLGVGGSIYSTGGTFTARFLGSDAGFTSDVYLSAPASIYLFTGHVTPYGAAVSGGPFPSGDELIFSIYVRNTGETWYSGPGSRNPDGQVHANITDIGGGCYQIGFEDLYGGGDRDYNDIQFRLCGGAAPEPPANSAPTADAGLDLTVECSAGAGIALLNGSGSSDPDGDALTYVWKDAANNVVGSSATASVSCTGLGAHTFTLTVDDGNGHTATDAVTVTVVDTMAPVIGAVTASPNVLWSPNHKMVTVTIGASAADACGSATCAIASVTSNEPDNGLGDGDTAGDWAITGPLTVELRAERAGNGAGRVYTITVVCTDASGNASSKTVTVSVPRSQGK